MIMTVMQKLTRKWKNSRRESQYDEDDKFSLPTRDDGRPIDTQEQEKLVRSLEKVQTQQSLLWRGVFSALLLCYAAFLIYSIYQQAYYPWELVCPFYYLTVFFGIAAYSVLKKALLAQHLSDWAAIFTCLMTIKGLLHESKYHRRWLWSSCCIGMIVAMFWLHHMLRLAKFRWDILWLLVGPLSGAGICIYVDHLLNVSSEEVRKLRGYMYAYKARLEQQKQIYFPSFTAYLWLQIVDATRDQRGLSSSDIAGLFSLFIL